MLWRVRRRYDEEGKVVERHPSFVSYSPARFEELCEKARVIPKRTGRACLTPYEMRKIAGEFAEHGLDMAL